MRIIPKLIAPVSQSDIDTLQSEIDLKADISAINVSNSTYVKTAVNATGSAPIYAARAWINFNGTGTVAIRASGNMLPPTDGGTGIYTINTSTAMPDSNYAVFGSSQLSAGSSARNYIGSIEVLTSSTATIRCVAGDGILYDYAFVYAGVIR